MGDRGGEGKIEEERGERYRRRGKARGERGDIEEESLLSNHN